MNNYSIISGILLVYLFSCSVSAGYVNGHNCTINAECDSANCNMGYCCNLGQCGSYYGCRDEGSMPIGGSSSTVCHNGSWMRAFGASCGSTSECAAGVCTTGFCCNVGQCGYSTSATGNCYNVGDTHNGQQCGAGGIWMRQYGVSCTNDSECLTGNCNAGYCCNLGQCGSYYGCLGEGQCVPTSYCDSGCFNGTFKKYFGASCGSTNDCSSGTCINGFCCNSGQCGYSTSRTGNCYNIGDERYIYKCVSEGAWKILNGNNCANNLDCVSNNCVNNICSEDDCEDLWWFDDDTRFCSHKEFCGEYMYYGLRTFQNLSDCLEELNEDYCVGEGNNTIIVPGAPGCCVGLTPINPQGLGEYGECNPPLVGASVCAICGNGVCGPGENKCNCPQDCPCFEGISINAYWHGSEDDSPIMQLWIDNRLKAQWDAVNMDRYYDYETNLSCGTHEILIAYNLSTQAQGTLSIYEVMAECTKLNGAALDLHSSGTLDYEYTKTNCGMDDGCAIPGDTPPCGEITLHEIVKYITKWMNGETSLGNVINLINAWSNR